MFLNENFFLALVVYFETNHQLIFPESFPVWDAMMDFAGAIVWAIA
ncbi:MAG: hypothetical protein F6K30_11845 [Cyanothece sp. SIO2G6]|nr:hypothetical protein [Cyanothece sp. SIO2G6]